MRRIIRPILLSLPVLFLALFFLFPLGAIMQRALLPGGELALDALTGLFTRERYRRVLWFSAWQAALSTLLTVAAALPAAYLFARYRFPGKRLLRSLAGVPFVLPTVVVALAFGALLGERGIVNRWLMGLLGSETPPIRLENSLTLVVIAHVFFNFSIVLRLVGGYWASADQRLEDAARVLGASGWRLWREIRLPLIAPALLAAALLVFMFSFAAFGTVLLLGGPEMRTVEVEIYDQAIQFNLGSAAALSLLQIAATLALTAVYTRLQRRTAVAQETREQPGRPLGSWRARLAAGAIIAGMLALLGAPLLALAASAFVGPDGWTTRSFELLWSNQRGSYVYVPPQQALGNSLLFAALATLLALACGIPAAYLLARPRGRLGRWLDPLFMLPLGTSAVTLGFGYIIAFRAQRLALGPLVLETPDLRASRWLIPLAHALLALPFVTRTMLPALRRLNPRLREAAATLGAPPGRVLWEIDAPLLLPAVIVSATFAWTVSLGDFGAALLLSRPENATLPVVLYRYLGQPGQTNYGQALAMSTLLMAVTLVSFLVIERLRPEGGEF